MRYQWEQCKNPNVRVLHVQFVLPKIWTVGGELDDTFVLLDSEDCDFARSLTDIPGVEGVSSTNKYSLQISKATLFEWEPICREVVEVVRRRFLPNGKMTEAEQQAR